MAYMFPAALWDPAVRWGTLVVRTETWIGLAWLLCLCELHSLEGLEPRQTRERGRALCPDRLWV